MAASHLGGAARRRQQLIHAVLYHHGVAKPAGERASAATREWLAAVRLSGAARQTIAVGYGQIDQLSAILDTIDRRLRSYARRQPGCWSPMARHFGVGTTLAPGGVPEVTG